jgi:ferrochelatase
MKAVLMANLGSPDAPEVTPVRKYLKQFLMDPFVIQLPWLFRFLIVSLFVLPKRPKYSAKAYRNIWWPEGSPLVVLSQQLKAAVQAKLAIPVAMSMRYGSPSIESKLLKLAAIKNVDEVLFIPLYPHYADSTVATSIEEAKLIIAKHKLNIKLNVLPPFYQDPDYIDTLVSSAQPYLHAEENRDAHLLLSYHGLPELHLTKADPTGNHCLKQADCCSKPSPAHTTCYRHQVMRTSQCFIEQTGLSDNNYSIAFQSRLGRAKWLEPSTENTIKELAAKGVKRLLVMCPAFVTDCLETLEEIEIQGNEIFQQAGGEQLILIPCLNENEAWVNTLVKWCSIESKCTTQLSHSVAG